MDGFIELALRLIPAVVLVAVRVGTALATMPAPFGELAPVRIRAVLGFMISLTMTIPNLDAIVVPEGLDPMAYGIAAFGEFVIGSVIGLTVRVTLAAAEMAGTLVGMSMGLGFATSVDPLFGDVSLPTTHVMGALGILIFMSIQGHHVVLQALNASLLAAPVGAAWQASLSGGILGIGSQMVARGLQIASPVVASLFIVQIGAALVTKAAPRVQLFALTFAVTIGIGLVVLYASASGMAAAITYHTSDLPAALSRALGEGR